MSPAAPGGVIFFSTLFPGKWVSGRSDPLLETPRDLYGANMTAMTAAVVIACVCAKQIVCVICPHEKSLGLTMLEKLVKMNVAR